MMDEDFGDHLLGRARKMVWNFLEYPETSLAAQALAFLSLLMVNSISNGHLQSDGLYTDGILSGVAAKIWFFVGFLFGFG